MIICVCLGFFPMSLTELSEHFRFGENWEKFSRLINPTRIDAAERSLSALVGSSLAGKTLIDVGCGSGLHSLAAARLGAVHITATDIDPKCIEITRALLSRYLPEDRFAVQTVSAFDLSGSFDVVYAWGSLHHTGKMWSAIEACASLAKPGGFLVLAIYKKTPLCRFWRAEKAFYRKAPTAIQRAILATFRAAYYVAKLAAFKNPWRWAREYAINRGMDHTYDVHDWLGGYPYESAEPREIDAFLVERGFARVRALNLKKSLGIFGSGCAEYLYQRQPK